MSTATPSYDDLAAHFLRMHRLTHLGSIVSWDRAANMPPKGNDARAASMAELAGLLHRLRTEPTLGERLSHAEQEPLSDDQRANVREMRREWFLSTALPDNLVERRQLAAARCEHAWRTQRPANDWAGFLENWRPVVAIAREEAALLADKTGLSKYDALMDRFEPGMTSAQVGRVFGAVRQWLPGLIDRVVERQSKDHVIEPVGPFPIDVQQALCRRVVALLGFDFDAGRLDTSAHPFSGGVPEDVRMTTRYREDQFLPALMGTVHETGHGRYEQNRPRDWLGQPLSEARSMAIHESQSLSFEMQLGSHPGFAKAIAPLLVEAFGDQPAFEPTNLWKLMTRVTRGLIRVDADEVTYPAHVILRFEIERPLIEGEIQPEDVPALWD
ncbi:MAG TPA: carboxypeptidase M32, partial [Burkholderiaceae bacterium]|nr:carboxypeptidase M32 [Burkholderiaceae bacterium]